MLLPFESKNVKVHDKWYLNYVNVTWKYLEDILVTREDEHEDESLVI